MANQILTREGAVIPFTITLAGLVNGAGRISAQVDLGAGPRPTQYRWRGKIRLAATGSLGNVIELYLSTSDGSTQDGALGTVDASLANADCRRNLQRLGVIEVDNATGTPSFQGSGDVVITARYVSLVAWNSSGQTLSGVAADHLVTLLGLIDEVQNPT